MPMQTPKLVITGRDGILNIFRNDHVKAPEEWQPIPGALEAVRAFAALPEAAALAAANKRIANILKKSAEPVEAKADAALFSEDAERALWTDVAAVRRSADVLFESGDYTSSLKALAALHGVMNRVADLSRLST